MQEILVQLKLYKKYLCALSIICFLDGNMHDEKHSPENFFLLINKQ